MEIGILFRGRAIFRNREVLLLTLVFTPLFRYAQAWVFGEPQESVVHLSEPECVAGFLRLKKARVRWFLSVDYNDIPDAIKQKGQRTSLPITMEGKEIEFSEGFTDLHTESLPPDYCG